MKTTIRIAWVGVCLALVAHAQYAVSANPNTPGAEMNTKPATRTGNGSPSGVLSCTSGRDLYFDTSSSPPAGYWCKTTGNPGLWVQFVDTGGSYTNPAWITSLAYAKITGVPSFLTAVPVPGSSTLGGVFSGQCTTITGKLMGYDITGNRICESDQTSGAGTGITTLNTLTGTTQTFAKVDDTNVTVTIGSSGTAHTWTMGWTGTLAKARQNAATVYLDATNTYTAGAKQTVVTSATTAGLNIAPYTGDPSGPADGDLWYNINTLLWKARVGVASKVFAFTDSDITGNSGSTSALKSATTFVNVSSATAPTIGQVLTATGPSAATWQSVSGTGTVTSSGSPAIHQIPVFTTGTDIKGITVGTTDKPLVGNTAADPAFSKLTLTNPATAATLTVDDGKILRASNSITLAGTDGVVLTTPTTSFTAARTDAANTFTGHQTIEGVTSTGATGTGNLVFGTNATLVNPALGTPASGVGTNLTGTAAALTSGSTNALKSATTTVDVSASAAPAAGKALVATDSTHATWQNSPSTAVCTPVSWSATPTFTVGVSTKQQFYFPSSTDCKTAATFTGNVTSSTLTATSATVGQDIEFTFVQGGTGRMVVLPTNILGSCTISAVANAVTTIKGWWDGANLQMDTCTASLNGVQITPTHLSTYPTCGATTSGTSGVIDDLTGSQVGAVAAGSGSGVAGIACDGTNYMVTWVASGVYSPTGSGALGTLPTNNGTTSAMAATAALTNGQMLVGQTGSAPLPKTVSGDATMAASGALTVATLSGVAMATAATATTIAERNSSGEVIAANTVATGLTAASKLASGTATLGTSAISANTCATVVTVTATSAATTDTIAFTPNADISAVTGYGAGSTDGLAIYPYPTSGNVNFKVCNKTGSSITPGAVTLNWRINR